MAKSYTHNYTPEKLARETRENVETIRKNAARLGSDDLVDLCDRDLEARPSPKVKQSKKTFPRFSNTDVVTGYHFVCGRDRGVTQASDGKFWSGSWVVAEANAKNSLKYGAYLALHESRSEASYRQGQILDFRRSPRNMLGGKQGEETRIEEGIEFLVQETNESYDWVGEGTGEKGYRWTKIAGAPDLEPSTHQEVSRQ
jgi:hypothetical protein